jgi:hypothetical protein
VKVHSHADERRKADLPGDSPASRLATALGGKFVAAGLYGFDLAGDNLCQLRIHQPNWRSPPAADQ